MSTAAGGHSCRFQQVSRTRNAALTRSLPTGSGRPTAYVALRHGIDAARWNQDYKDGIRHEETPYGFHLAQEFGFDLIFAQDESRKNFRRSIPFIQRLIGCDVIHAWTNRKRIAKADIVWTMTEDEGFAVALLCALRVIPRKPIICNVVWMLNHWSKILWYKDEIYRYLVRYFSVMTVHSERCLVVARRELPTLRSELMYFGMNSDLLVRRPPRIPRLDDPLQIVSLGSDRTRDWTTLLAAFGNDPRFRLTIVCWRLNDGDVANYDNVTLLRVRDRAGFVVCLNMADIAVVPMIENIFSGITSALDAVAVGVPVVCSRTGGVPTYFNEDEVYFVPVGDPDAMRQAVVSSNPAGRLAKSNRASQRFLERDYSSRRLAQRYCEMSASVLGLTCLRAPAERIPASSSAAARASFAGRHRMCHELRPAD